MAKVAITDLLMRDGGKMDWKFLKEMIQVEKRICKRQDAVL